MLDLGASHILVGRGYARRLGKFSGASLLAMTAAGLAASPAFAQAAPGSAECPVVGNVVTCSGALPGGVAVTSGTYAGLGVSNVTGDMAATDRPVIGFRSDAPTTTVTLNDPDSVVRLTTTPGPSSSNLVGAIQAILPDNDTFSLTSNLDIVVTEQGGNVRIQPAGIIVAGEGGTFDIVNGGDIEIRNLFSAPDSAFILVDAFGADLVSVRNSGDLVATDSDVSTGIIVAADNRRVEIVNEGDILNREGFIGISIEYQVATYAQPIGGLRQATAHTSVGGTNYYSTPVMPLESYEIRNSGVVEADGFGIAVRTTRTDLAGNGQGDFGAPDGSVVNDGIIRSIFGILVTHYGDKSVLNNGRLENIDDNSFHGISVAPGFTGDFVPGTVRVENGASGVIEYDGTFLSRGIEVRDSPATVVNAGIILLRGGEFNRGMDIYAFGDRVGLTTIENSGTVDVDGASGRGIYAEFRAGPTGAFSDIRLVNSGLIETTGDGSRALTFFHGDLNGNPGGVQRGRVSVDLAATSVVRGGSGADGAAIAFTGGESHGILNRGLITAPSGRAIIGGTAAESLDNSGRIEGSVVLAAGNDAVTMRGGSVSIGTLDGGADTDILLFDVATGEASATGPIINFESVSKTGSGTLTLRDTGTIAPGFSFVGGTLLAEGSLGSTAIAASSGTTLGGSGSVGDVVIADGATVAPGREGVAATLSMASLDLSSGSILRYDLAQPGMVGGPNDLLQLAGALRLDGRVDINALPGYGPGVYRLINYGGALTNNSLVVGTAPEGQHEVQTSVAGQVNLVFAENGPGPTPPIQFWDGADTAPDGTIDGANGTWGGTTTNWTRANGEVNEAWNGNFAVFQGAPGTVAIDSAGVSATGLQFAVSGYTVSGGPLTLAAPATVRVGDGSGAGSGYNATIASAIGGTAGLTKTDLGTLILTGANGYTGGTTVSGGILQVSTDNALGAAPGGLTLDGGTLRAGGSFTSARALTASLGGGTIDTQANNLTLSGPIGGTAGIAKVGPGILVLTGSSGAYGGHFTLGGGTLRLDGTLGGTLEALAGTTLSGTGTAGNLIVAGTLSPGNSIGTLSATGNATFRAGSTFAIEISAAGAADRLNVAGTATIEGGTVAVTALDPELNYTDGATYTFLSAAGGRTGTFAGLSENSAFLDYALGYTGTTAFLTVDVIRTFPEVAGTFNQTQAAMGLRELDRTAGSDSLAVYNAILLLDEAPARAAFDASSGEIYAVLMASSLRQGEMAGARLTSRAYESRPEGLGIWGGVEGYDGSVEDDGNGARFGFEGRGANLGLDYRGRSWAFGVGGGWSSGDVELPARASRAETDAWHIGAFASAGSGHRGFSVSASVVRTSGEADVSRSIAFGTISRTASSRLDIETTSAALDLRYGIPAGRGWAFGPALGVAYSDVDLGRFAETGASSLGLSSEGSSDDWTSYAAGAFASLRSGRGSIDTSVQYLHGRGRSVEAGLALAGAPSELFRVRAAVAGEDAALVRLSARYALGGGWSAGGNLRAITGGGERSVAGTASVSLAF